MATRSLIGIQKGDMVEYIYCHYDGYPSGVGHMLVNFHNSQIQAEKLITLGDLSTLGRRVPTKKELAEVRNEKGIGHWSDDVTMSYNMWRDEPIRIGQCSLHQFLSPKVDLGGGEDFRYLWNGNAWECRGRSGLEHDMTNP